jgi:hypothetical protein
MRVLCLHPSTSSAHQLHSSLSSLEERLWTQHGIELVFIDAPLLDVRIGEPNCDCGGLNALIEEESKVSRRWYVEELVDRRRALPPSSSSAAASDIADNDNEEMSLASANNNNDNTGVLQYSGLDASLLHLTQIWSRGGANNPNNNNSTGGIEQCLPFQGILGIHQGADVAAMLPLLSNTVTADYNDDPHLEAEKKESSIFEGLQFVILVDGRDIRNTSQQFLLQHGEERKSDDDDVKTEQEGANENENDDNNNNIDEEDWYVGPNGIASLHVIAKTASGCNTNNATTNKRNSEVLAKRYGPNATIQYYNPTSKKKSSSPSSTQSKTNNDNTNSSLQQQQEYNHNDLTSPSLHNILGKYLVSQKNILHTNPQKRKLLQLQHQLSHVEQLATLMITEEVRKNPPKCLMAMIGPAAATTSATTTKKNHDEEDENENIESVVVTGKTVGAWQGPGRIPGEQGGGAPCPETFLLRQEERRHNGSIIHSNNNSS